MTLARSATDGYAQAALIGTLMVVLVGGLSLAVTTVDGLRERRRAQATLIALGMPVRMLRRGVVLQSTVRYCSASPWPSSSPPPGPGSTCT